MYQNLKMKSITLNLTMLLEIGRITNDIQPYVSVPMSQRKRRAKCLFKQDLHIEAPRWPIWDMKERLSKVYDTNDGKESQKNIHLRFSDQYTHIHTILCTCSSNHVTHSLTRPTKHPLSLKEAISNDGLHFQLPSCQQTHTNLYMCSSCQSCGSPTQPSIVSWRSNR